MYVNHFMHINESYFIGFIIFIKVHYNIQEFMIVYEISIMLVAQSIFACTWINKIQVRLPFALHFGFWVVVLDHLTALGLE